MVFETYYFFKEHIFRIELMFDYLAPIYDLSLKIGNRYSATPVLKNVEFESGDEVLDIGGGTGYLGDLMKKEFNLEYVVLDSNKKMLSKSKQKNIDTMILGNALNLPFKDQSFDMILCVDALHHFMEKTRALEEMKRVLKDRGKIVILDLYPYLFLTKIISWIERRAGEESEFLTPSEISRRLGLETDSFKVNHFQFLLKAKK
ncbi:hypothetical protein C9439_00205 [archaeon SCG-AAA382B04]|nr:hypothetical protein C9439_00205 [archaeon SCG-AAA382B04]